MIVEILSKIGFDWHLALANTVNFLAIFFVLKKYFFRPLADSLEKRKQMVNDSLSSSKLAEAKLAEALEEKDRIILEAHQKAKRLTDKAEAKGEEIFAHFKDEGAREKERLIALGETEVARKEQEARIMIQNESAELIVSGAEKLIGEDLDQSVRDDFMRKISQSI